ncbi:hypothetical protein KFE25_005914 [Diacronema lutheri]|uniref:F-box domain-containing protein n=1 Tax=Diacronema lutheri TaxID=2081491 RepID=A0A8J5Y158_DIALT|nr:hypothetical protein KFE25_005914 [Diacronema lutheri]
MAAHRAATRYGGHRPSGGLLALPPDLLAHALSLLPSVADFSAAARTCRVLRSDGVVERAVRLRLARARVRVPDCLPPGEVSWLAALLWLEVRARHGERCVVGAGAWHSAAVDARGVLHV